MMNPNLFSPFNISKVITTLLIAVGSTLLIVGTINHNRPLIISGVISIIASALIGIGIMFATRQQRNRPVYNVNINNPLLADTI